MRKDLPDKPLSRRLGKESDGLAEASLFLAWRRVAFGGKSASHFPSWLFSPTCPLLCSFVQQMVPSHCGFAKKDHLVHAKAKFSNLAFI